MANSICSKCGDELPAGVPERLCPSCLLKVGMEPANPSDGIQPTLDLPAGTESEADGAGLQFRAPEPSELAASFPQLEILSAVGQGGMGAVYKARQKSLDRVVALKIIKADMAERPGFAERFAREAKALAHLNHPNIVSVHDFGQADGLFYFIMEYVDGADLRHLIQSKELSSQQALSIVPQICEALQYAHDQGIVHRDIKPENILVDKRGQVKIADFGLAKLLRQESVDHQLTGTHQVMGTLRYMAPEQLEGAHGVDHRADIYSLGVVLYELLTGELPLGRFAAPSEKAAIDDRLDEVVMRALEKELPRRYQHASELKSELERVSRPEIPQAEIVPEAVQDGSFSPESTRRAAADRGASQETPHAAAAHAAATPHAGPTRNAMSSHVTILGVLHVAFSFLIVLVGLFILVFLPSIGFASQDKDAATVLAIVGSSVGGFLIALGLPGLIVGIGLLKRKGWSRLAAMVLAVPGLFNLPFGTMISIYTYWVMLHRETIALFEENEEKYYL